MLQPTKITHIYLIHKRKQTQTQTTQLHSSPKQFIHQLSFSCGASGSWLDLNWLVGAARLSSLLASCLGAGPPIQTHQKRIQLGCLFSAPRFIEEFHVDWCCCSLFLCGAVRQLPPLTHPKSKSTKQTHFTIHSAHQQFNLAFLGWAWKAKEKLEIELMVGWVALFASLFNQLQQAARLLHWLVAVRLCRH